MATAAVVSVATSAASGAAAATGAVPAVFAGDLIATEGAAEAAAFSVGNVTLNASNPMVSTLISEMAGANATTVNGVTNAVAAEGTSYASPGGTVTIQGPTGGEGATSQGSTVIANTSPGFLDIVGFSQYVFVTGAALDTDVSSTVSTYAFNMGWTCGIVNVSGFNAFGDWMYAGASAGGTAEGEFTGRNVKRQNTPRTGIEASVYRAGIQPGWVPFVSLISDRPLISLLSM